MKRCNGCGRDLAHSEFHKHTGAKDGLQARCKSCQRENTYRWRAENPDRLKVVTRRSYETRGRDNQRRRLYGITPKSSAPWRPPRAGRAQSAAPRRPPTDRSTSTTTTRPE